MIKCIICNRRLHFVTPTFRCSCEKTCQEYAEARRKEPKTVAIFFDAACEGRNTTEGQPLGLGVYTTIDGVHAPEWSGTKTMKWGSNNDGEWGALVCALSVAVLMKQTKQPYNFRIFGDSEIVVRCFNGVYKTGAKFKKYSDRAESLRLKLGANLLGVSHVPREKNQEADLLSKEALKAHAI